MNVQGKIVALAEKNTRRGLKLLTIILADNTGTIQLNFFNQAYLKKKLKSEQILFVHGKVSYAYGGYGNLAMSQILSFDIVEKSIDDNKDNHYNFMPIYTLPDYLKPKDFRNLLTQVFNEDLSLIEIVPEFIRKKYNLMDKKNSYTKNTFSENQTRTNYSS